MIHLNSKQMKKLMLLLGIVLTFITPLQAQEGLKDGTVSIEVKLYPANEIPIGIDNLRTRYFLNENLAIRLGLFLDREKDYYEMTNDELTTPVTMSLTNKYLIFGVYPGVEMHFPIGERLSPYMGAEMGYLLKSSRSDYVNPFFNEGDEMTSEGVWLSGFEAYFGGEEAYSVFSLGLIGGTDIYIYKGLYMGVELGLRYSSFKYKDWKVTSVIDNVETVEDYEKNNTEKNFGFYAVDAIRLGWKF